MDDITPSRTSTLVPISSDVVTLDEKSTPENWLLFVHPQGSIYFRHNTLRVVTDQDIRNPDLYQSLMGQIAAYPLPGVDEDMELLIHVQSHLGPLGVKAYSLVINHKHCIAGYTIADIYDTIASAQSNPNLVNRRRRLYWNYLCNHPAHVSTPQRAIPDALDGLTWFYTDNLISGARSTAPFSKVECDELTAVINQLSRPTSDGSISKTLFLAWLLRELQAISLAKTGSRPVAGHIHSPYLLFLVKIIINLLFFGIPHSYYAHIKSASEFRGRLGDMQKNWDRYTERLVQEYSNFLLTATVLLSATVGFLAVPNIAEGTQVSATISAFTSLGSIIVGVFSMWRHQTNTRPSDSFAYMHNAQHNYLGFHGHAMLLSLPPVLLIWAVITFAIAVVAYTMQNVTEKTALDRASTWSVFAVFLVLSCLVCFTLYTFSIIWHFRSRMWDRFRRLWK